MELASASFRDAASALFDRDGSVVATVHVLGFCPPSAGVHPGSALRRRPAGPLPVGLLGDPPET